MQAPLIISGPPTSKVSKAEAEAKLVAHPQFPKDASFTLEEVEGRWIAAIAPKQSAPPAFLDGGDAGETPDGPPDPDDAPKGPPSDDNDSSEESAPSEDKSDKEPKGEKGLEAQVHHLTELLTRVVDALGLGTGPEDSPVPGLDEGPPSAPPEGGPASDSKTHTVHERALKPGESPPGTTPIGAPAFASVADDHPWKDILGKKRTFKLEEPIGDQKLADVNKELQELAQGTGYRVAQLVAGERDGVRVARALITQ